MTETPHLKETLVNVRHTYLTIRCPLGCEAWLHPRASVRDHADRCQGRPWVDEIEEVAVVPTEYTSLMAAMVDVDLLGVVNDQRHSRAVLGDGRAKSRVPTPAGRLTVETPIVGVRPRRWLTVAIAATERFGLDGLVSALDPAAFHELEAYVLTPGAYVECPTCGALITTRGLKNHQATNALCSWTRAANEVRTAWATGWRDPYSVHDAPLTWGELRAKKCWRDQLRTVLFPRWIAVLLPATEVDQRPGGSEPRRGALAP